VSILLDFLYYKMVAFVEDPLTQLKKARLETVSISQERRKMSLPDE